VADQWIEGPGVKKMAGLEVDDSQPELPPRPYLSVNTDVQPHVADSGRYLSPHTLTHRGSSASNFDPVSNNSSNPQSSVSSATSTSSSMQKALEEARHFAGGLISHPSESTKHYSILRHSHGLVFYQGPNTTFTISIFSDAPLPADRTIWLQSKGWTGKTGMRAKAFLGRNNSWLNVTPTMSISADKLKPTDERAWQRDIAKFRKKAVHHRRRSHILRETAIVRIPTEAEDGYFELMLCTAEKKVLCPSPSFRVLSTSASPHSIRGASLMTLPLELGAMALGTYGRRMLGTAVAPVSYVVQSQVQKYMPSWWTKEIASTAYSASGAEGRVNSTVQDANARYDQARDGSYGIISECNHEYEQGPKPPYPVHFVAGSEPSESGTESFNIPSLTLLGVSERITQKLHGHYFGWARFVTNDKKSSPIHRDDWSQVVLSVLSLDASQLTCATIAEANKRYVKIQFIEEFDDTSDTTFSREVKVMGFIRPDEPAHRAKLKAGLQEGDEAATEAAMATNLSDISVAQSVLDHPLWGPEFESRSRDREDRLDVLERVKSDYADVRVWGLGQIDRVPFARMGIRAPTDRLKDKAIVANGFWVPR